MQLPGLNLLGLDPQVFIVLHCMILAWIIVNLHFFLAFDKKYDQAFGHAMQIEQEGCHFYQNIELKTGLKMHDLIPAKILGFFSFQV
jgi:hypothetical protein